MLLSISKFCIIKEHRVRSYWKAFEIYAQQHDIRKRRTIEIWRNHLQSKKLFPCVYDEYQNADLDVQHVSKNSFIFKLQDNYNFCH